MYANLERYRLEVLTLAHWHAAKVLDTLPVALLLRFGTQLHIVVAKG